MASQSWNRAPVTSAREGTARISSQAVDLIKLVTLELSGIRDGNGRWYMSNPITGTGQLLKDLFAELDKLYLAEHESYWAEREAQRNGDGESCATEGEAR
jgi:hypothetical protein